MSILINSMEMPSDEIGQRGYNDIRVWYDGTVETLDGYHIKESSYKVVPVPPHGRLIDADALKKTIRPITEEDDFGACTFRTVKELMKNHIDDAPTIIEAEGE